MLRTMKPVALPSYGRRERRRLPSWLVWLGCGITAGAIGVIVVQERYLPPRLSAAESAQLRASLQDSNNERQRLQAALDTTSRRLDAALADRQSLSQGLDAQRHTADSLRDQLAWLVDALPPDPRGGAVQVRAAHFSVRGGRLHYQVVLSRSRATDKPWQGVMQVAVAGQPGHGPETLVRLPPVDVALSPFQALAGALPLPDSFRARQATVNVLDRPGGRLVGMRVLEID
jgi:hypothetical protein